MKKIPFILFAWAASLFGLEEHELEWKEGPSVQEYHSALQQAALNQDWWKVIDYASILSYNFATTPFAKEASYLMGEAYFKLGQYEAANECFTAYLNHVAAPKHFEEAIEYKFNIAKAFSEGTKKRLFSSIKMPAWLPAEEDSIAIFDEVIAALPYSSLAAESLLAKARVQAYLEDFKPSLETLDVLIRKFPKDALAAESYLEKLKVYLMECEAQELDPDILDLAALNLRKFRLAFPRDERLEAAQKVYADIEEVFAKSLYETGYFFEKTKKLSASKIYYKKVLSKYPDTEAAKLSRDKLEILDSTS